MIVFNKPAVVGSELDNITNAITSNKLSGDGPFTKLCHEWFDKKHGNASNLLTSSCTHALELAAILIDIKAGDEVIMPSYTFVSTANAFVLRGAKIVFVDVKKDTLNIDESLIESAITSKTKAIVPVHYAGVSCEMDEIMNLANKYGLFVIEDAAQGMMSQYNGKPLGTIGHLGAFSFHETKNYTSGGEGGLLLVNDPMFVERAEIIREKGTNRSKFFRGYVDKYSWVDIGSSYLPSEIQAAYLYSQLKEADTINDRRLTIWNRYYEAFIKLEEKGLIEIPHIPKNCKHNAHMFYIKLKNISAREELIVYLKKQGIMSVFHYIPLHTSDAGKEFGRMHLNDINTTEQSEKLLRLPIYFNIGDDAVDFIIEKMFAFFDE
ncbi:dTDP-4-amino-4,6-dideoxygalactose transaminase [Vibrio cyclitrophicus]